MGYWDRKHELATKAAAHTDEMARRYPKEIANAIAGCRIYGGQDTWPPINNAQSSPEQYFLNTDSVSALLACDDDTPCVLNFASFKEPGGMFLAGSSAQEESLCHESFLYNVLNAQGAYYCWNNMHKNRSLYEHRAIFTPSVLFERNGKPPKYAAVITCAAPNFTSASRYCGVSEEENNEMLKSRIRFIKAVAEANHVSTLIAGAYGCGVFGQNPEIVALAFKDIFAASSVRTIIYAVPGNGDNPTTFRYYFTERK